MGSEWMINTVDHLPSITTHLFLVNRTGVALDLGLADGVVGIAGPEERLGVRVVHQPLHRSHVVQQGPGECSAVPFQISICVSAFQFTN